MLQGLRMRTRKNAEEDYSSDAGFGRVSLLGKTAYWLGYWLQNAIQVKANPSAYTEQQHSQLSTRLAASLEAYAEMVSHGDRSRAYEIVRALEVPKGDTRLRPRFPYQDVLKSLDGDRYVAKYAERLRKTIERFEGKGKLSPEEQRELREARRELSGLEEWT